MGKTQVGRPGDPATRRPGDPATRRPGDPATRRPGDPATRRPGDPATRRPGDPAYCNNRIIRVCQAHARTHSIRTAVQTQRLRNPRRRRAQRIPRGFHHGHRIASEPVTRPVRARKAQDCQASPYPTFAYVMPSPTANQAVNADSKRRHRVGLTQGSGRHDTHINRAEPRNDVGLRPTLEGIGSLSASTGIPIGVGVWMWASVPTVWPPSSPGRRMVIR